MYRSLSKLQTGYFFMFYFYLPNLENRKPAIWRHLISCVCFSLCWATKMTVLSSQTIHCFKEICYWTALHAGHVWFYFLYFCAWRCSLFPPFLYIWSDDSSMSFITPSWPPHFFGTNTKKWQDSPTLLFKRIQVHFSCVEVLHHRLSS